MPGVVLPTVTGPNFHQEGHKGVQGLVEAGEAESKDGGWSRLHQETPAFRALFLRGLGCSLQLDSPGHTPNTLSKGT